VGGKPAGSGVSIESGHPGDLDQLLASRHDNGADFWSTTDGRIGRERPISTLTALLVLSELRVPNTHEALAGAAQVVMSAVTPDGRVRVAPQASIYPCHTAMAAAALCRNGYASDPRTQSTLTALTGSRFGDGGWRCNKFSYGHGPETDASNPGATLFALDAFRCADLHDGARDLDAAVETLLRHWTVRAPTGPCHFGIGTRFLQVEYPFLRYNLFYYVYVLSFYENAKKDPRFAHAFTMLQQKLDDRGQLVVERPHRHLETLHLCRKGAPSQAATERYQEIITNIE